MLNKAVLMGRLTANPELRTTQTGISVTSFTLAVNRRTSSQNKESVADFIDIVAWRHTAEFVSKYFTKGMQVALSGSIQTRTWKDKEGNNRKSVEVVADEVFFADSKRSDSPSSPSLYAGEMPAPGQDNAFPFNTPNEFSELDDDDELPF